jgi:hypothetical protein
LVLSHFGNQEEISFVVAQQTLTKLFPNITSPITV